MTHLNTAKRTDRRRPILTASLLSIGCLALDPFTAAAAPGDTLITATPPIPGQAGRFGSAVALPPQGNIIGIGESAYAPAGKAYTFNFRRRPPALTLLTEIEGPLATAFGQSMAFRGSTLYVGAPDTNATTPSAGQIAAVAGTRRTPSTLLALYLIDGLNPGAAFGHSLSRFGPTILIGAPGAHDGGTTSAGKAYLINARTKTLLAELSSPAPREGALFGYSVSRAGPRLAIGAPLDGTTTGSGRVYVLRKRGANYTTEQILENPNPEVNSWFGYQVVLRGPRILVGAPGATITSETQAGRAYIFSAEPSTTSPGGLLLADLRPPQPLTGANFGAAVALPNGRTAAIGAPGDGTTSEPARGAVYFFQTADGLPLPQLPKYQSSTPQSGAHLGYSVTGRANRMLIGEPGRDGNDGAAHLITLQ